MATQLTRLGVKDLEQHQDPLGERRRGGVLHGIVGFLHWFGGTESTFSLKLAILAVALACPAWITNNGSAKFYYEHKGGLTLLLGRFNEICDTEASLLALHGYFRCMGADYGDDG